MIRELKGINPKIGENSFVADSAEIIGDVKIGKNCSVWFHSVLRGDVMPIEIGDETNIQDGSTLHGTIRKCGVKIGNRVTVGHNVILHGCEIEDKCLIGMGSIIMDKAKIGKGSIVGAGSLVVENSEFPPGSLIMGRPAKAVRPLKPSETEFLDISANNYIEYKGWYTKGV
jgi:carbonic anhydrase/acetyltransferase-like protein (isoleucine patch superfamily)